MYEPLKKLDFLIDENYTKENEVWVISINERVDETGEVRIEYTNEALSNNLKSIGYGNTKIANIKVKQHKESWAAGGSEINISIACTFLRMISPITGNAFINIIADEVRIADYSRAAINRDTRETNKTYWLNWWDTDYYVTHLAFTIYEYDGWPAGHKYPKHLVQSCPDNVPCFDWYFEDTSYKYRSDDTPYYSGGWYGAKGPIVMINYGPRYFNFKIDETGIWIDSQSY